MRPERTGSRPNSVRRSRVRPAPMSPAMPSTSPRWSVKPTAPGPIPSTSRIASPAWRARAREEVLDAAADHQGHDLLARGRAVGPAARVAPVAQHHEPVGDLFHFLDEVRDVDDGVAVRLQPAHQLEQALDVLAAEAAGGLVEDEDARADGEGAGDLDELLLGHGEAADHGVRRDVRDGRAAPAPRWVRRRASSLCTSRRAPAPRRARRSP